jgi:quercetin dioxygenase-like cupin family protein
MLARREFLKWGTVTLPALPTFLRAAELNETDTERTEKWYWYPGHLLAMKATGRDTGNTCTWMLIENSPREGVPFHKHLYEDESFYVVEGLYEITVADRTVEGGPGTYMYGPRKVPHRWTNVGKDRGRLLNVFSPSGIEGYFLSAAIPLANRNERPAVDLAGFQARTAAAREKFGIIRTGPLKYPTI